MGSIIPASLHRASPSATPTMSGEAPAPSLSALFSPLALGDLQLRNRIAMSACTRAMSPGGVPTADVARYYARRARDGVGLVVTEGTVISPRGNGYPDVPGLFDDAQVRAWRAVTWAVHDEGGVILCQLWHTGAVAHPRTKQVCPLRRVDRQQPRRWTSARPRNVVNAAATCPTKAPERDRAAALACFRATRALEWSRRGARPPARVTRARASPTIAN